jgi:hypothetical protein
MTNQQTSESIPANAHEAFFLMRIIIRNGDRRTVFEDGNGVGKMNPVLAVVCPCLDVIPFERHDAMICTDVCTLQPVRRGG